MTYKLYYLFLRSSSSKILQNLYIKLILKNKKINLKRFVQPSGYEQSWEKCAEILIGVGYPRNSCVIDDMFKWLQDLNWQGAKQIKAYLPLLPRDVFISHYEKALIESINSNERVYNKVCKLLVKNTCALYFFKKVRYNKRKGIERK